MTVITTRLTVSPDGTVSLADPLPAGEHIAAVTLAEPRPPLPRNRFSVKDLPRHDLPWDGSISLRREDMYDDEGRLR